MYRMYMRRQCLGFVGVLISVFSLCTSEGEVEKPTFPDAFQVEVQGIFQTQKKEVDGSMYYDKLNNRAAISFTYQNEKKKYIYNFNDDEFLQIEGNDCQVSEISSEAGPIFFPFTVKDNKKVMGNPEEVIYFTNSTLDRQDMSVFPTYVYVAKLNFPSYGRSDCDVIHIFSKPEVELPNCDEGHACKSTLVAISVKCMDAEGKTLVDHTYNFFRFQAGVANLEVFQPPVGLHCDTRNRRSFPGFPEYFSFSYHLLEEQEYEGSDSGIYAVHKKVWYDSKLKLIRIDEFEDDGLLTSSRIFDFYGGTAYTVIASLSVCEVGPLTDDVALDQMTKLPKIFFKKNFTDDDAVYIGKRDVQGMDYEVWSLNYTDEATDAMVVEQYYYIKNLPKGQGAESLLISHVNIYIYERNDETALFELSVLTHLSINNFRTQPKEWEAFDISSCFENDQKKGFKLKVEGPPTLKNSRTYEEILERMYMKLIITTNVSVVRINELSGVFDGMKISEFTGWILNKTKAENSETGKLEPDMDTAFNMIEASASAGNLSLKIKKDGKVIQYKVTAIEKVVPSPPPPKDPVKDCFSGASMAAASLVLLVLGFSFGIVSYYVFLKKRRSSHSDDKVQLHSM